MKNKPPILLTLLFILLFLTNSIFASTLDNYCGKDWVNAANACPHHCPSGDDSECTEKLGPEYGCFLFTGCHARVEAGEFGNRDPEVDETDQEEGGGEVDDVVRRYCGVDFIDAMLTCDEGKLCPNGDECGGGEVCVDNTNCDKPLVALKSEIVFTFTGTTTPMEDEDWVIFNQVIFDLLKSTTTDLAIHLESITLQSQKSFVDTNTVEVYVLLQAKYRPPPIKNLNTIAENSINLQKDTVRANLKKMGAEQKRYYFTTDVKDIDAISKENATKRPTLSPTDSPTITPTSRPSSVPSPSPSSFPTSSPSAFPSSTPSREHIQEVVTAPTNEIKNMDDTSHGFLVNMRTKEDSPVVLIQGLDFYIETTDTVGVEVWTRLGSFEGFEGTYDGWDMVASGMVKGAGYGRYTSIPFELFTPVSIPGGGGDKGTRAFYITLNTKALVFKLESRGMGFDGATDTQVMASSPDLEIYNGKAVLSYPFPNPEETWFYHSPRTFLGVVTYDRLPCKPFSLYGPVDELPCGDMPTMKPTVRPTLKPTIKMEEEQVEDNVAEGEEETITNSAPTLKPSSKTTQLATSPPSTSLPPTTSISPTVSISPSMTPTAAPITSIKARIIVTLHNTPARFMNEEEQDIFIGTLVEFLNNQSGRAMVISGIDILSEDAVEVISSTGSVPILIPSPPTDISSSINTTNTTSTSKEVARSTIGQRLLKDVPKDVPGVRLTILLKVISTTLPHNLLGNMAVVAVEENQEDLVQQFRRVGLDYPYFEAVDRVTSRSPEVTVWNESGDSSSKRKPFLSGGDAFVNSTEDDSSVNVALLVTLFWLTLAVVSIVLLVKARSKIMNDNLEKENSDKPESSEHSDSALRTSILRLIPLGSDIESDTMGARRSLLRRSRNFRKSITSGDNSFRDESNHSGNSLRDSNHRRSGLRSSMRRSLTMSQILGVHSDSEDDAPLRGSGARRSGTGMRASLRRSMSNSNHDSFKGDDAPLRGSGVRKSGTGMRASMRRSMSISNLGEAQEDDAPLRGSGVRRSGNGLRASMRRSMSNSNLGGSQDEDAPLRGSGVRRSGNGLRASMRRSMSNSNLGGAQDDDAPLRSSAGRRGLAKRPSMRRMASNSNLGGAQDDDAPLRGSGVRTSGTGMRASIRQSNTDSSNDNLEDDEDAKGGDALNTSRARNNLSKSVVFDDNLPTLMGSDEGDGEEMKSEINVDSEPQSEEGEKESKNNKSPGRGQRKTRKLSQSMTAKDTMSWGITEEEKKEDPVRLKNDLYKPQRMRRSVNEGNLRSSTTRGSAENLARSESDMGRLRRSTRRESDGDATNLRRSSGGRDSSDNLRRSTRTASGGNGNTDSSTLRRSSGDTNLRGSVRTRADTNLRSSVRRSTVEGKNSRRNSDDPNLRASLRKSTNDASARGPARTGPVRRSTNEASLRGSVRRSANEASLRGSVRRSTNEASLRGSVRRTTATRENLRGSVRRSNSDGNEANEQQRRAGPRRREIV